MIQKVVVNSNYVIALCKWWESSTNIFYLPIGECTMTLKEIKQILYLPMEGASILGLSKEMGRDMLTILIVRLWYHRLWWGSGGLIYEDTYKDGIIGKLACFTMIVIIYSALPNSSRCKFPWKLYQVLREMREDGWVFARGPTFIIQLYHKLY